MSVAVTFKTPDFQKIVKDLEKMNADMEEAEKSALSSVGYYMIQETRDFMKSEGEGSWKKLHPLTQSFQKKGGDFIEKEKTKPFLSQAGSFARYFFRGDSIMTGFAFDDKNPNRKLEEIIDRQEKGYSIPVTPKMRRFRAVQTGGKFLLKKTTTQIKVPPRPIEKPIENIVKDEIFEVFQEKYSKSLGRKNDFADKEFRGGLGIEKE